MLRKDVTITTPVDLAARTGRGVLINLAASGSLFALYFLQSVVVARCLTPAEVGLFALASGAVAITQQLKQFGIPEKFVQDRDCAVEETFGTAFTLEIGLSLFMFPLLVAVGAFFVWWYHELRLVAVIAVLSISLFEGAANLPANIFARDLRFERQRGLQLAGSLCGVVATIGAALLGSGIWALAGGRVVAVVVSGALLWSVSGASPRFRWRLAELRRYARFGAPVWASRMLSLLGEQGAVLAVSTAFGMQILGHYYLAERFSIRLLEVSSALNAALYPALSFVQDVPEKLRRGFEQSNRLLLMWAFPVGCGLALFANDLVPIVFGAQWVPAIPLVEIWCVYGAVNAIGYNWNLFFQVRGETWPRLVYGVVGLSLTLGTLVPAMFIWGVAGIVYSMIVSMSVMLWLRQRLLRRIFPGVALFGIARGSILATLIAVVLTEAARSLVYGGPSGLIARMVVYAGLTLGGLILLEQPSIAQALGLLRQLRGVGAPCRDFRSQ